jgi:high-affinity nickel-transport protein
MRQQRSFRGRVTVMLVSLIAVNIAIWLWAVLALQGDALLLGTAIVAYTFGLRHAVDADHIAAIDNATRKLMQSGQRPLGTGLFFSLGHSAIVIMLSALVAITASNLLDNHPEMKAIGGVISTLASAGFLFLLAIFNILVFRSVYLTFRDVKAGKSVESHTVDAMMNGSGFLTRLFRKLFHMVDQSWHLLFIGFLFGLGFDTASEVALFGISASQATNGLSWQTILVFPALFTAGMSLVDTIDGIMMVGAYGWAYEKPIRKLYYNMTITGVSVIVALVIGALETLNLIGDQMGLSDGDGFFGTIGAINDHFGTLGYIIIGVFVMSWILSLLLYRIKGYDRLDTGQSMTERSA